MRDAKVLLACFLALNLLFSGVPVQARATDAAIIPAEATVETVPEETVKETRSEEPLPEPTVAEETAPAETTEPEESIPQEQPAALEEKPAGPGLYTGLLGGHSTISMGSDIPEIQYQQAQAEGLDFFALSDHGDSICDDDWAALRSAADTASGGRFLGFFGYEMNWPRQMQLGHIRVFGTADFAGWQQEGFDDYRAALENFYALLAETPGALGEFSHPGTQYGTFDDFGHYTPAADRVMTLLELDFEDRDPCRYYTKALDKGWHVAPTGCYTAVFAEALTEDALLDALRNCRAYATENPNLEIHYEMNGYAMGSRLKRRHVGEKLEISLALCDPAGDLSAVVEVITNGGTILATQTAEDSLHLSLPVQDGYYFLRITQSDGRQAVTAPIWVDSQEALGITDLACETPVPVQNESVSLTLKFSNWEDAAFAVAGVEILADGECLQTFSESFRIPANSDREYRFSFSCGSVGITEITLRLQGTLEGCPRRYEESIFLSFHQSPQVTGILVDAGHENAGLDSLTILSSLANRENIRLEITENITAALLQECRFLVIPAPAGAFSPEFMQMIAEYCGYGGSLILCGRGEDGFASGELNRLLNAVDSTLRFCDDMVRDSVNNGGESHQLYPEDIALDSSWCTGVMEDQVYRAVSGCSIDIGEGNWLVRARGTAQPENAVLLAWEELSGGGAVFAAGSLFLSDTDLEAPKNLWDLPYANRTIAGNLLGIGGDAVSASTITQARAMEDNSLVRLRGYVTAGNTNRYNTFPDTIYLQDDSGGIAVMPFPDRVQTGTGLEVMGFLQTRNGNHVLKLSDWKPLDTHRYHYPPETGDWEQLLDPARNGGSLVEVEGKCLEIYCREDDTLSGCLLEDDNGNKAVIQIEEHISAGSDGVNDLQDEICKGRTVRAVGILHINEYGENVIRVRNCEEVFYVMPRRYYNPRTGDAHLSAVAAMTISSLGLFLLHRKRK